MCHLNLGDYRNVFLIYKLETFLFIKCYFLSYFNRFHLKERLFVLHMRVVHETCGLLVLWSWSRGLVASSVSSPPVFTLHDVTGGRNATCRKCNLHLNVLIIIF